MKYLMFALVLVACMVGVASATHCNVNQVQRVQSYGYNYGYNDVLNIEVIAPHNQLYVTQVEPVLEVQKVERIIVPHEVSYVARPQRVQQIERIRVLQQQSNYPVERVKVVERNVIQKSQVQNLRQRVQNIQKNRSRNVRSVERVRSVQRSSSY